MAASWSFLELLGASSQKHGRGMCLPFSILWFEMRGSGQATQECVTRVCGYFKLTTVGALESQEEFFASFLTAWKNLDKGSLPGRELLPETASYIRKIYLHGRANICLPNICSFHLPVSCFPPLWSPRLLLPSPHLGGGLVIKLCPTLATPWTVAHQAPLSMHSPEKNTEVVSHFLLQGIFQAQGLNPGLLHCRQILYQLWCQGSPST